MDISTLLEDGARLIKGNDDEATSDLESESIVGSLMDLLGDGQGSLNLSTFVAGLSGSHLGEVVGSWLGNAENMPISSEQINTLFGNEKISHFSSSLGISERSATEALSDALPQVIDRFTSGEASIVEQMLGNRGTTSNTMETLSKMFR
ncbi:protein of unknown function DUF937 [hydrothermal vent metagenome]|uniref:DUF937 domain-containing protein n=1 Tax=hydrothermal vent metagenome TaxID=652676 RepID=A0A1W1CUX9_9ZZZZ